MTKNEYKYFQVRPAREPEVNGTVLRVSKKGIEVYAGESELKEFRASFESGHLTLAKKYLATEISEYKARQLREDCGNWGMMQMMTGGARASESLTSRNAGALG